MIQIPDVKGKSLREARNKFDDWGLRYDKVKEVNSFNVEKGKVVKCDPPIGSQVNYGDLITVYISKRKTYPYYIVAFIALLLLGFLGRGSISKLIDNTKKKHQIANVCILNCDTNGDGIPDTNLDTDGDGICDKNCDGNVTQNGEGNSTDGKNNENPEQPENTDKNQNSPSVKVETGKQNGNTVVKVTETKGNAQTIKYADGSKTIEYFSNGGGTPVGIGEYVIIGNTGTITIYAGGGGSGSTTTVDVNNGADDVTPPSLEVSVPDEYSNNPTATLTYDKNDVAKLKVMKGEQSLEDIKEEGKEITTKTSYKLDGNGTWTFAAWDKNGNGITETVTYNKYDNVKPTFTIDGDFITPKKTVTAIISAKDDHYTSGNNYFTIYYAAGKLVESDFKDLGTCKTAEINNCKMKLTNNEHLGINVNDTYTFIVYDQAGNYETSYTKTGGEELNPYLTVENANSELSAPTFNVYGKYDRDSNDNVVNTGWTTKKYVTITYPEGFGGEYSLDGGETWDNYMDAIEFNDDGKTHEIIARVMSGDEAIAASSILITKIDNATPNYDLGLTDNGKFPLGADTKIPASVDTVKSGVNIKCYYSPAGTNTYKEISNLKTITDLGYYDFKCSGTSGSGKVASTQVATNVKAFIGIKLTFNTSDGGVFTDESCNDPSIECNSDKTVAVKSIEKGDAVGTLPSVYRDGYAGTWYTEASLQNPLYETEKPAEDKDYFIKWNLGYFTLTLDACGSNGEGCGALVKNDEIETRSVRNGNALSRNDLSTPVWEGHIFIGWYSDPTDENSDHFSVNGEGPKQSMTLYAHWMNSTGKATSIVNGLYTSGSYSDQLSKQDGVNIRYTGSRDNEINNHVALNNGKIPNFRILGLFNVDTPSGTKKLIKLVGVNYNASLYNTSIMREEDGRSYSSSAIRSTLESQGYASLAESVVWKVGTATSTTKIGDAVSSENNSTDTFVGKVGILSLSDIVYSSPTSKVSIDGYQIKSISSMTYSWLMKTTGYSITQNTFIMNGESTSTSDNGKYILYLKGSNPKFSSVDAFNYGYVYPTIYLPENAEISGGDGSENNPYIININ